VIPDPEDGAGGGFGAGNCPARRTGQMGTYVTLR